MTITTELTRRGDRLSRGEQDYVLRAYVHRFTGDHRPAWSTAEWRDGQPYPLQFADDADWLAHTTFVVTKSGRVHRGNRPCASRPTWPNNPKLRRS